MEPYRIVHKAGEYKPIGHRDVGRPKRRWEDDLYDRNRSYGLHDVDGDDEQQNVYAWDARNSILIT
jgi:hypothetical protein